MSTGSKTMVAKSLGQRIPSFAEGFVSDETRKRLENLVAPHVDSYNYFIEYGLSEAIQDIPRLDIKLDEDLYIKIHYTDSQVAYPSKNEALSDGRITPREARERGLSYTGLMLTSIHVELSDSSDISLSVKTGDLPVMVMSERCHLKGLSASRLVQMREEANEVGGYFITNGIERVIRLLQIPRRNYAMAIERSSYKNRGLSYSDKGVTMRCVRKDQSSVTLTLHYLNNGGSTMRFVIRKQEFLLPVVMVAKSLVEISDKELFDRIVQRDVGNTFMTARLELLLRDAKQHNLYTKSEYLAYLGSRFRDFLPITDRHSDEQAGAMLMERFVFVHTEDPQNKLECLIHMIRKLFAFVQGKCAPDNADALMNHEILLPGHLLTIYVKEKLEETLLAVRQAIVRDYKMNKMKALVDIRSPKYYQKQFDRFGSNIGSKIGTFLATGNVISSTGMDLMQVSGYSIVGERLNILRYMSHFQSVHRGQFFTTMKTTTVRKLLPESWGFMCPVHTPDGAPCGLLNHLTRNAVLVAFPTTEQLPTTATGLLEVPGGSVVGATDWLQGPGLRRLLVALGVMPAGAGGGDGHIILTSDFIPVLIDGVVLGGIQATKAADLVSQLRFLKVSGGTDVSTRLDPTMEIAYIAASALGGGAYPGVYLFTQPGRIIRPVLHCQTQRIEWIGPLEQVFMDIACLPQDVRPETTHQELAPTAMLSQVASLTPFSDYNQSPRNMYQCQMGKQTMGTPAHAIKHRADNKMFRILNVQAPLVQTQAHREYCMDEYPQGVNAVVAVISYTGYDMEDAMIINKAAFQRGFGHGCVYKTKIIDLDEEEKHMTSTGAKPSLKFYNVRSVALDVADDADDDPRKEKAEDTDKYLYSGSLDADGLPPEGTLIKPGRPLCCLVDQITGEHRFVKHKEDEEAYVDTVRVLGQVGSGTGASGAGAKARASLRRVSITLRFSRQPIIGDKFSSRHGQKGTLSVLWPQESMPFSESGISPDVLINPHAFPSRMTIGMLIESMAGKSGAMHGMFQDATPFQFHEERRVIDYVGEQLRASGYSYYGSEPLYNGLTGNIMHADIFMGVVFYQRLRHMVSDKAQVRSTGQVVATTRQPVKGRKKHGGIRLGEMERDSLLSHGVSFCLHDRLMNCSDAHLAHVCAACGGLLSVHNKLLPSKFRGGNRSAATQTCSTCDSHTEVKAVYLPYVYRYLTNELAAMGIKLSLKLAD